MELSSFAIPQEYELVASFNRQLCASLDTEEDHKRFPLKSYYETLTSQHNHAAANVIAISTAVECHMKELGISPKNKELAGLKRLSKRVQNGRSSETGYRKQCSTGTLVAIWSWDTVAHYSWHELGVKSLATLAKLAKKYPTWERFVGVANSCMITRHEESVHNAEISSIGFHDPRSTAISARSSLEPRDLTSLLAGISESLVHESQQRINRWIRPCKCLAVQGRHISDEQLAKRTLKYDSFGMLVKSDAPFKRFECSRLCERPQAATAGKRPVDGSMDAAMPLKRPRFGTLAVPKPCSPATPSSEKGLRVSDIDEEGALDGNEENDDTADSDDVGSRSPHVVQSVDSDQSGRTYAEQAAEEGNVGHAPLATPSATQSPFLDADATHGGTVSPRTPLQPYCESVEGEDDSSLASTAQVPALAEPDGYVRTPTSLTSSSNAHSDAMLSVGEEARMGSAFPFGPCSPSFGWRPLDGEHSALRLVQNSAAVLSAVACPLCNSVCDKCTVPAQFGAEEAIKRYRIAHSAHDLPRSQKAGEVQNWMTPIRFARLHYSDDLLLHVDASQVPFEEADACVWSWDYFRCRANAHDSFTKPIIIKQDPTDTCYDLQWFLHRLRATYAGKSLSARKGRDRTPQRLSVEALARLLSSEKPTALNVLSLDDITFAAKPHITSMARFTLLERLISRAKVDQSDDPSLAQKCVRSLACDVESCTHFNILASRGAFSAPHRDSMGATWIHMLFGSKLWWVVTSPADTDVERLHEHIEKGRPWHPKARERALILKANDVLIMPHEYPVLHAVLTLEPTLAHGGMFWDDEHIESVLELIVQNAEKRHCTNEPMAFQLPAIIHGLDELTYHEGVVPDTNDHSSIRTLIDKFKSLKCDCHNTLDTCEQDTCPCFADGRRCWSLCGSHPKLYEKGWPCMSEDPQ